MRIHHCYADGIALVRVMLSMTDADRGRHGCRRRRRSGRTRGDAETDPLAQLLAAPLAGILRMVTRTGSTLIEKGAALWQDPAKALALAGQGGALTAEIAKLALMGEDSATPFKGKPGVVKRVAWADPIAA